MRKTNKYNVYDTGQLILENVTSGEITKILGCTICINTYAIDHRKYKGRYTFEITETEGVEIESKFAKEWNATINLFKNVIWVKTGGRKLCIGK